MASSTSAVSVLPGRLGGAIRHDLHAEHQPHAADVADEAVRGLELLEAALELRAHRLAVRLQIVLVDHVEHGLARRRVLIGLPPNVLKWMRCVSDWAISMRVVTAAIGAPLPRPLAIVTKSGMTS